MIQLKGRQAGALKCVIPAEMSERQMLDGFRSLLSTGSHLLEGSEIIIDLQSRSFSPALLSKIWKNFIEPSGCCVNEWIVGDGQSREWLRRMGFKTSASDVAPRRGGCCIEAEKPPKRESFVYVGTLRGGQKVSHDGDVIIVGNINQGSEIAAGGNVTIIGRLNGLVHAGCSGDDNMCVIARSLEAGQVRLGTKVGIIDRGSIFWGKPVFIRISDDEVQVMPWPAL